MGAVRVPAGAYWVAQTQRALEHFAIGQGPGPALRFHPALVRAQARIKLGAARVNRALGTLDGPIFSNCGHRQTIQFQRRSRECTKTVRQTVPTCCVAGIP